MNSTIHQFLWQRLIKLAYHDRSLLVLFVLTLLTSAALLFSVQPLLAKMILPKLGGTPSVWAVSMCFFQGALLAGYYYAHLLNRHLNLGPSFLVHLLVLTLALVALPLELPAGYSSPPEGDAYWWLLGILTVSVGLPFFAVAASAPLLQSWFARSGHAHSSDPYFLYGASNLGSLTALIAYPFIIEPTIGLVLQSNYWSRTFLFLTLMITVCGFLLLARRGASTDQKADNAPELSASITLIAPTSSQRVLWIVLGLIPSGLMVAVTTYITTDLASTPLLWILPLALYLLTFILMFRDRPLISYKWTNELFPVCILGVIFLPTALLGTLAALLAFFGGAIVCHRELYLRRPAASYLTEFYLLMSLGGVLGGILTALIAPQVLTSSSEFILLLIGAMACRPGVLLGQKERLSLKRIGGVMAFTTGIMLAYKMSLSFGIISSNSLVLLLVIIVLFLGLIRIRKFPEHRFALVLTMLVAAIIQPRVDATLFIERSFFGTHRVVETTDGSVRMLLHGTTVHGAQRLKSIDGQPVDRPLPLTYYNSDGPMARGIKLARSNMASIDPSQAFRAGIVGLGTGALACQSKKGDVWRYYEIDPTVVKIAQDPTLFTFLARCQNQHDIILGDARIALAGEANDSFNMLLMDAFSSDSVPVHLLTVEAIELYLDKLDDGGILSIHISNRHLDLAPALFSTITTIPGTHAVAVFDKQPVGNVDRVSSDVLFVSRKPEAIAPILYWAGAVPATRNKQQPWTDDYSDVLSALLLKLAKD